EAAGKPPRRWCKNGAYIAVIAPSLGRLVVKRVDLFRVLLGDRLALELHRRRQLIAAGLPVDREDLEALHLLDAGELLVSCVEALLDLGEQLLVVGEGREVVTGPVLRGPALRGLGVERQQRADIFAL